MNRVWSDVARERFLATTTVIISDGEPLLDEVPRTPRVECMLLGWCVHLVGRPGDRGALEMTPYYHDIGRISDEPHDTIYERVVSFIALADFEGVLTEENHIRSFSHVARLLAMVESERVTADFDGRLEAGFAADNGVLGLTRPLADFHEPRVAVEPLRDEIGRVTAAAEYLHRVSRDLTGGLQGVEFR